MAGAVRYRFYVAEGLTLPEVAQVQVLFGLTYSLGFATLCGLALVAEPQVLSPISAVPPWVWRGLGLTLIGFVLGYLAWAAAHKGPVRLFGHELPSVRFELALTQTLFSAIDLSSAAAALYVLLPPGSTLHDSVQYWESGKVTHQIPDGTAAATASFLMQNNIKVSFVAYAGGITGGCGNSESA